MRAWRAFGIVGDRLCSLNRGREYVEGAPAECERPGRVLPGPATYLPSHPAPAKDCTCGYYALKDVRAAIEYVHLTYPMAIAEVEASGIIQEHEGGLRAQYLRVVALYFSPYLTTVAEHRRLMDIAIRYKCELREEDPKWRSESISGPDMSHGGGMVVKLNQPTQAFQWLAQNQGAAPSTNVWVTFQITTESEARSWFRLSDLKWGLLPIVVAVVSFPAWLILGWTFLLIWLLMYAFFWTPVYIVVGGFMRRRRVR